VLWWVPEDHRPTPKKASRGCEAERRGPDGGSLQFQARFRHRTGRRPEDMHRSPMRRVGVIWSRDCPPFNWPEMERRCDGATVAPWKSYVEGRDHSSGDSFIMTGANDIYLSAHL